MSFFDKLKNIEWSKIRIEHVIIVLKVTFLSLMTVFGTVTADISIRLGFFFPIHSWIMFSLNAFNQRKKMRITGDRLREEDRAILISNHYGDADWYYIFSLLNKHVENISPIMITKKEVFRIPLFSGLAHQLGWPRITRTDRERDRRALTKVAKKSKGAWPIMFLEGYVYNEKHLRESTEKRKELGLPVAEHVLLPRVAGMHTLLNTGNYNCIYDVTMSYDGYKGGFHDSTGEETPTFKNFLLSNHKGCVVMHIQRRELPNPNTKKEWSTEEITDMVNSWWKEKDARLERFIETGKMVE